MPMIRYTGTAHENAWISCSMEAGAKPEKIDMGYPVQINRIFGSKENLFFIIWFLFFSESKGCSDVSWRLPWIRSYMKVLELLSLVCCIYVQPVTIQVTIYKTTVSPLKIREVIAPLTMSSLTHLRSLIC
jgi:hypothetical protein